MRARMSANHGLESAGSVLKRIRPELVISKQKLRQADGSCRVRLKREEGKQNVGFSSRPFVLCGLPVRKPPINELLYERRNGNFLSADHRSPDLWLAVWARSHRADLPGYARRPTAESDGSFSDRGGDAGDVRHAQGR